MLKMSVVHACWLLGILLVWSDKYNVIHSCIHNCFYCLLAQTMDLSFAWWRLGIWYKGHSLEIDGSSPCCWGCKAISKTGGRNIFFLKLLSFICILVHFGRALSLLYAYCFIFFVCMNIHPSFKKLWSVACKKIQLTHENRNLCLKCFCNLVGTITDTWYLLRW